MSDWLGWYCNNIYSNYHTDDHNDDDQAIKVAKELANKKQIVGIIVPYSSHATYYQIDELRNEFKKELQLQYHRNLKAIKNIDIDRVEASEIKKQIESFKLTNNQYNKDYALVILPDAFIIPSASPKTINIINENKKDFLIAGSWK